MEREFIVLKLQPGGDGPEVVGKRVERPEAEADAQDRAAKDPFARFAVARIVRLYRANVVVEEVPL